MEHPRGEATPRLAALTSILSDIKWGDPGLHALAQVPFVAVLYYLLGPAAAISCAAFWWLGRETGQKSEGVPIWQALLRPFRFRTHTQSLAEWAIPVPVAALEVAILHSLGG